MTRLGLVARCPVAIVIAVALTLLSVADSPGGTPPRGKGTAGPPYTYTTELVGQFRLIPLKNQAMITRTKLGYRYRAGQQDSHLVVEQMGKGLRFTDSGTKRFNTVPRTCRRIQVNRGVAAVCRVPKNLSVRRPLLVEIWPRLGDDFVDGSTLPATFAMTVLADAGNDIAHLGAGPDFFNGHTGRDLVTGGAGNDWIRSGHGNDRVHGGAGHDQLVGIFGNDTFYGGKGNDLLGGGPGHDRLNGGPGRDLLRCVEGRDTAHADRGDRLRGCERVRRG
jgi:serralysin